MRVTIKPKVGYRVRRIKQEMISDSFIDTIGYDVPVILFDGSDVIMIAGLRSLEAYIDECKNGGDETARFCECFTTIKGNKYVYWRSEEFDEDFITLVERGDNKK